MVPYLPPHLRNASPKLDDIQNSDLTLHDIHNHFWPITDGDNQAEDAQDEHLGKTLHDSAGSPGTLAYLILFSGANPRWEGEHIIFTKSSLDLLPSANADGSASETIAHCNSADDATGSAEALRTTEASASRPIAVFKQKAASRNAANCQFEGWYQIDRTAFLEPESEELVRMLEQKWTKVDRKGKSYAVQRGGDKWQQSLQFRWAVVKLSKDEVAMKERGHPNIQRLPLKEPAAQKKGVNEMLEEMRLKDTKAEAKVTEASSPD